jgi:hypothetical protein
MNIHLSHGLATQYYITDPERSLAMVSAPCHVILTPHLGLEALAAHLSWLVVRKPGPGSMFSRLLARPADRAAEPSDATFREQCRRRMMDDFKEIVNGRQGGSFGYEWPTVFLAREIDRHVLMVTTVLKLRGLGMMLAVAVSEKESSFEQFTRPFHNACQAGFLPEPNRHQLSILRFNTDMSIVAGLHETVISTERSTEQIIAAYPSLVSPPLPPDAP